MLHNIYFKNTFVQKKSMVYILGVHAFECKCLSQDLEEYTKELVTFGKVWRLGLVKKEGCSLPVIFQYFTW